MDLTPNSSSYYPPGRITPSTLEEDLYQFHITNNVYDSPILIHINWTNIINMTGPSKKTHVAAITNYIKTLDPNAKYFIITQHDDCIPLEILPLLPRKTIIFSAGGNIRRPHIIPIPLVYTIRTSSNIPDEQTWQHMQLASFIGSDTNELRRTLAMFYVNNTSRINIRIKPWTPVIDPLDYDAFLADITRSRFILAPSGYGPTSFRFYEAFAHHRIPVYIHDSKGPYLPYTTNWSNSSDMIDWNKCCIILARADIPRLAAILSAITYTQYIAMLDYYAAFAHLFTPASIYAYITRVLETFDRECIWEPKRVATLATAAAFADLVVMLKSLEICNITPPTIHLICDSAIHSRIPNMHYTGTITSYIELDEFTGKTRKEMEHTPYTYQMQHATSMWNAFMLCKIDCIKRAFDSGAPRGVFFLDADIIHLAPLPDYNSMQYKLAVSPHYITPARETTYGKYNAGFIWFRTPELLEKWRTVSLTASSYYEQKALELVADAEADDIVLRTGMEVNYGWWRMFESADTSAARQSQWSHNSMGQITILDKELASVHTHLANTRGIEGAFNNWLRAQIAKSPYYNTIGLSKLFYSNLIRK